MCVRPLVNPGSLLPEDRVRNQLRDGLDDTERRISVIH